MPWLVLLNGPPAAGKSTLARRLVADRPLALVVDIDMIRSQMGGWLDDPEAAGRAARTVAVAACRAHLGAGHDVVVPQFLGRIDFIDELAECAADASARFIEVVLQLSRTEAVAAFDERRAHPTDITHHDAVALVDRSSSDDPVGDMYDTLRALNDRRPEVVRIDTIRDDVDQTLRRLVDALRSDGMNWWAGP